jgi:hypothetical protein
MHAMRFQNFDMVSIKRLRDDAKRFGKPRLSAAISAWQQMQVSTETGTVLL